MTPVDSPRLLVLETSGQAGTVALAAGPEVLAVRPLDEARRHARDLAPATAALLAECGWVARDLAGVIVSLGPGSYTGLRVGVMSAKALAYATGCALLGVDTFAAIARQGPAEASRLDVLADAQQDKVYVQSFERAATGWQATTPLAIVTFASWLANRDAAARVTGPGLRRWQASLPDGVPVVAPELREPRVESLLGLGLERCRSGERDDVYRLEPLYLRPSSAEEQWQSRAARGKS